MTASIGGSLAPLRIVPPVRLCCDALTCCHQSLESTAEQLRLRSADFLRDHDIELITEKEVSLPFFSVCFTSLRGFEGQNRNQ